MRSVFLWVLLFAWMGQSIPEEPAGLVWLGFKNPACGGILIERDVVLSAKSCFRPDMEIIWPFKGEIRSQAKPDPDANLVILFLTHSWPNPIKLIQISDVSKLQPGLFIYFSNESQSTRDWINTLKSAEFTLFLGLHPPLVGSPVWTKDYGAIGMVIEEKKALRLDPYFNYISTEIKSYREKKYEAPAKNSSAPTPVVISAQTQPQTYISIPAQVAPILDPSPILPAPQLEPKPEPQLEPQPKVEPVSNVKIPVKPPPESLGCSCLQVRRFRR